MATQKTSLPFYQYLLPFHWIEILRSGVKFPTIWVLLGLGAISGIALMFGVIKNLLPYTKDLSNNIQTTILEMYPDDLVVSVINGELSTNSIEPVRIPFPRQFETEIHDSFDSEEIDVRYLATIDPAADLSDFEDYQSLALLTDSELIYIDKNETGQLSVVPYEEDMSFSVNETLIQNTMGQFFSENNVDQFARIGVFVLAGLLLIVQPSVLAFLTAITTIFVWIYAKIASAKTYSFSSLFVYTLAISAIPIFVIRTGSFFLPVEWIGLLQGVISWLVLGLAYVGLARLRGNRKGGEMVTPQEMLMVLASPLFAVGDLIASKRSSGKKILYACILLFFYILPWIGFGKMIIGKFTQPDQVETTEKFQTFNDESPEAWQTHIDPALGISFAYPSDLTITKDTSGNVSIIGSMTETSDPWPYITISTYPSEFYTLPAGSSLEDWVVGKMSSSRDSIGENMIIAGMDAPHLITNKSFQAHASDEFFIVNSYDKIINITLLHTGGKQDWDFYNEFLATVELN